MIEEKRKRGRPRKNPVVVEVMPANEGPRLKVHDDAVVENQEETEIKTCRYRITAYKTPQKEEKRPEPDVVEEMECTSPSQALSRICKAYGTVFHVNITNLTPPRRGHHGNC